ncbi:MAG: chromosomal replication initiator protein DnaA, partial [Gammaproteobacteria bacterium]|nr:chromosomal replication initiator protein DnaA [Gammaproteobacteria bacterium]
MWSNCLQRLEQELSDQQLNTWIRPLQVIEENDQIKLLAPNRFVQDWVKKNFHEKIQSILLDLDAEQSIQLNIEIGSQNKTPVKNTAPAQTLKTEALFSNNKVQAEQTFVEHNINPLFTFDNFVEGKSNQLAKAASIQVSENPGSSYNPLFFYGGVGLGKTHLMHAVGNMMLQKNPQARITYIHSERFVSHMVKALQHNAIDAFKQHYRSLDAILVDDIQFFAGKERSQEEFFHTFNALLEGGSQIILTCDRYPKEVDGLEERLKSRFGWGLPVCIDPPELETRV